jgi:preprotein translocase subunit SecF
LRLFRIRIIPDGTKFRIVRFRRVTFPFSATLTFLTIVLFLTVGLNFGIDFKGGTLIEMQAKSGQADIAKVRQAAEAFNVGDVEVQEYGGAGGVSVRFPAQPGGEAAQNALVSRANAAFAADYTFQRVESVGPRVSNELVQAGTLGVVLSVIAVMVYLWFRFELQLAIGAIIGTLHDVVLIVGFFIVTQFEFNMTSIAAILTIVGYSLNETVVVFDRTREILRRYKAMGIEDLLDLSVNSTLSRTAMTSITTLLALAALVLFGGHAIRGFAVVMFVGVIVCTYSAMFVSTPVLIYLGLRPGGVTAAEEEAEPAPAAGRAAT